MTDEPESNRNFVKDELYKHWYRAGSKSGFLSVRSWYDAGKLIIDIGETGSEGLKTNTLCYVDVFEFATYLRAVAQQPSTAIEMYPIRSGLPSPESFIHYGGGKIEGKPVSRILKVHHWSTKENTFSLNAFAFKAGMFEARESKDGAFIANMDKPISMNMIKISRTQVAEIAYRIDLSLTAFTLKNDDWLEKLNGQSRTTG